MAFSWGFRIVFRIAFSSSDHARRRCLALADYQIAWSMRDFGTVERAKLGSSWLTPLPDKWIPARRHLSGNATYRELVKTLKSISGFP